jgi:hypothetical protein
MLSNVDERINRRTLLETLIGCSLEVWEADRFGRKIGGYIKKPVDIITNQFGTFLANVIAAYTGSRYMAVTCTMKTTGAADETMAFFEVGSSGHYSMGFSTAVLPLGCRVGVGTGASAAARTDYNLQTQVGSWTALSGNAVWTSATGKVTFAGSVLLASEANVTEAGLEVILSNQAGVAKNFLFLHDVFGAVPIAAGKYAHVAYELQL